ncbi:MAG: HipA family kinase [Pseudomonadota bacterium]|nr:HipA family kinase [Pseudomonadota bacterium]
MIEIVEIVEDTVQGLTRPALCHGIDGNKYIVKGREAQNIGLKKEYICAHLGQKFGLPIPEFTLATFPNELLEFDAELVRRFGNGPCFASKYYPHLQEFDRSSYSQKNAQFFKDLFVFDYWIKNDDRNFVAENGGNPNLIVDSKREKIFVIDHNLAFDEHFELESFKQSHAGCKYWFEDQIALFNREAYEQKMSYALQGLEAFVDTMPEEWCEDLPGCLQTINDKLSLYNTEPFWRSIQ